MSKLTVLDGSWLEDCRPQEFLNLMFSMKCAIDNSYSSADGGTQLKVFTQVGKGQCDMNEGKKEQLYNDYCRHGRVEDAFNQTSSLFRHNISLPSLGPWVGHYNELLWEDHHKLFPGESVQPTSGFISGRIFPVPLPVRAAIVDAFAPRDVKRNKESFLSQPENKDCLVRIYLGRRQTRAMTNAFRLRNFDMTVNEMEFLRLDTELYAETLAQMLAFIHWKATLDANDVEFVLGSAPAKKNRPTTAELEASNSSDVENLVAEIDYKHRSIGIWVLDFDQSKEFPYDRNGVKQLERGFYFNDPYYPRPVSQHPMDVALWNAFKERSLATSAAFITTDMPKQFIDAVEAEGKRRRGGGSLFN